MSSAVVDQDHVRLCSHAGGVYFTTFKNAREKWL